MFSVNKMQLSNCLSHFIKTHRIALAFYGTFNAWRWKPCIFSHINHNGKPQVGAIKIVINCGLRWKWKTHSQQINIYFLGVMQPQSGAFVPKNKLKLIMQRTVEEFSHRFILKRGEYIFYNGMQMTSQTKPNDYKINRLTLKFTN